MKGGKHKMARQRRLHRYFRGFTVTDFADQDNVRIMSHDRPQYTGKIQANQWIDLNLLDALEPIFNRIFNGKYVLFRCV